jgi:1-acyl-sn-glycerol-3-phosphate acyltransferase
MYENPTFRPARPRGWVLWVVQNFIRIDLALQNRLRLGQHDLEILQDLPRGAGVILASNHADETDFKICLELSRLSGRRFLYMMNREAFDEAFKTAGWWLQRLGAFSVERGGDNAAAKRYAIQVVERGCEVLVVFPEGQIYYLNDLVQPLKSGAVDIGMQAVVEARQTRPDWAAYLVPMAIKYRYRQPIRPILERRIQLMEQRLSRRVKGHALQSRLALILSELLHRQEIAHHLKPGSDRLAELSERVQGVRHALLSQMEEKYADAPANPPGQTIDRTWQLSAHLRGLLTHGWRFFAGKRAQVRKDLATLNRVAQMGSWQPQYVDLEPSQERLAEMVLKLEREVYRIQRPHQLANRDVFVRIGAPIDLGCFIPDYLRNGPEVRHRIAEQLRDRIQDLINAISIPEENEQMKPR